MISLWIKQVLPQRQTTKLQYSCQVPNCQYTSETVIWHVRVPIFRPICTICWQGSKHYNWAFKVSVQETCFCYKRSKFSLIEFALLDFTRWPKSRLISDSQAWIFHPARKLGNCIFNNLSDKTCHEYSNLQESWELLKQNSLENMQSKRRNSDDRFSPFAHAGRAKAAGDVIENDAAEDTASVTSSHVSEPDSIEEGKTSTLYMCA